MIGLLIARFWPALIPLAMYLLWHELRRRKSRKQGDEPARLSEGPWVVAVAAALLMALVSMLWYGVNAEKSTDLNYFPPSISEDGSVVHGHFEVNE